MTTLPLKPFYFLRHGQTDWNLSRTIMGSKDIPLNDPGMAQARAAGELLKTEPIGTIVTSPLLRARQTADLVAQHITVPVVELPGLKEAFWGDKEGTPWGDEVWITRWQGGGALWGAETYAEFALRIKTSLAQALAYEGSVLIISHGFVYQVIRELLGLPPKDLENCEAILHHPPKDPAHVWAAYVLANK